MEEEFVDFVAGDRAFVKSVLLLPRNTHEHSDLLWNLESRLRLSDSKEVYSTPDPDDEPKPDTYWLKISSVSPEEAISGLGTLWDS
ncbi:hypothetical protein F2Q69_00024035 [Brassica cretica]|uniref:Uncharacterized protein n=1 Tax=Brassica cretica TaxID=69181 RepID=A0A8S9Q217_BRACR|nr:hypothetical protein F2Q69_00024035 [Brassica cretica]